MDRTNGLYWLSALAVWITVAVVVSYTLLAGYRVFAGAFVFWVIVGAVAIVLHMLRGGRV